jgi:hypothetical protein
MIKLKNQLILDTLEHCKAQTIGESVYKVGNIKVAVGFWDGKWQLKCGTLDQKSSDVGLEKYSTDIELSNRLTELWK